MFPLHVCIECFLTHKLQVARHTGEGLVHFVNHLVPLQLVFPCEGLPTVLTHKWSLPSVDDSMPSEFVLPGVAFTAHNTNIRTLSCVDPSVHAEPLRTEESLTTRVTVEREIVSVGTDVILQLVTSRENLTTNVAYFLGVPTSGSTSFSLMTVVGHVGGEWCECY